MLRLRKCSPDTFRPELSKAGGQVSIVRELHVYGSVVPVNAKDPSKFQHQGFGILLMEEAARIAKEEHDSVKISVISGNRAHTYSVLKQIFCSQINFNENNKIKKVSVLAITIAN